MHETYDSDLGEATLNDALLKLRSTVDKGSGGLVVASLERLLEARDAILCGSV